MNVVQKLLKPNPYSRPQTKLGKVAKVVVHYTGNPKSTAQNNRDYFNNAPQHKTKISSHYVVGLKGEIIQCIPENEIAYCSNQANVYSISVETCHPDSTGKFNAVTEQSLVELVADVCKRHGLNPIDDVIRHFDVTGKRCPLWYVSNPSDWKKFKERVKDMMNPKQSYYKVVSSSYKHKEDADKVSQAMKLLGCYAETQAMSDEYYSVVSYSYSTRSRANEIVQALKLFGRYAEVRGM